MLEDTEKNREEYAVEKLKSDILHRIGKLDSFVKRQDARNFERTRQIFHVVSIALLSLEKTFGFEE